MNVLSQDSLEEVLLRVPAEELLNLKRVSKSWKATIECPHFIKRHIMKMASSSPQLLVLKSYKNNEPKQNIYAARRFLESPAAAKLHWNYHGSKKKKNTRSIKVHFFGSCNGLVCLVLRNMDSKKPENVVLWNPCTNQQFDLPLSPIKTKPANGKRQFGYDEVHDEYKVVSLAQFYDPFRQDVEVYSLKTNSWRSLPEFPYVLSKRLTKAVFARGSMHWCMAAAESGEYDYPNFVIVLDLATEKYHLVSQPEGIGSMKIHQIEALDDSLILAVSHSKNYWLAEVWVMKEYGVRESWTKLSILPPDALGSKPMAYSCWSCISHRKMTELKFRI